MKFRCEWIKSERYQKKMKEEAKKRDENNPMKICVLKYDHFENIHRLDPKLPAYEGAPNFRQVYIKLNFMSIEKILIKVPGYLVFGTGQPTKDGFQNVLKFIFSEAGATKCLWTSMRQVL